MGQLGDRDGLLIDFWQAHMERSQERSEGERNTLLCDDAVEHFGENGKRCCCKPQLKALDLLQHLVVTLVKGADVRLSFAPDKKRGGSS